MPVIAADQNERFELHDVEFTSLVRPARHGAENAVWRVRVTATEGGAPHSLDHDEVIVALDGRAVATLDGVDHDVVVGDTVFVPTGTTLALRCAGDEPFVALAVLPAGSKACLIGGEPFVPPWAA
jgi:quercetin dioxygenase-like cupin family protein